MQTVCPLPAQWHEIYQRLLAAWEKSGREGVAPPKPLILAGWAYSNDVEKKRRWEETVAWANSSGLDSVLQHLRPDHFYGVAELTTYNVGPMGGSMHLPWSFDTKTVPNFEAINEALTLLEEKWVSIAGPELAGATRPLRFSGAKSRRLVVLANPKFSPPWGSWSHLAHSEARRAFTHFRAAINEAVHPLEVDHVDFVHSEDA
jgi:hypothetical protein